MKWREERGSAFLLVVFMILIFTMLGVAVLSASIGGAQRSQKSEDNVQTVHLADKALSEAVAHVMARFDNQAIDPENLTIKMEDFVANFQDSDWRNSTKGVELDAVKEPEYRIKYLCLIGAPSSPLASNLYCKDSAADGGAASPIKYKNKLRVTAEAIVNGVKRDLTQIITLDTFPDFLRFAVGSEGDVVINGAPSFKGSLYAGKQLKLQNVANYTYHGNLGAAVSQFFYLQPVADNSGGSGGYEGEDRDDLGNGKIYVRSYNDVQYRTDNNGAYQPLFTEPYNPIPFHGMQKEEVKLTETKKFLSIEVAQSFIDKAYAALKVDEGTVPASFRDELVQAYKSSDNDLLRKLKQNLGMFYSDFTMNRYFTVPFAPSEPPATASDAEWTIYRDRKAQYDTAMAALNEKLSHLSGPVYIDGDLTIGKELQRLYYDRSSGGALAEKGINDWLIVNGDLTIQNDAADTDIPIRANMLVKGKVILRGKIAMDATIFSLDGVQENEIVDAQIRGLVVNEMKNGASQVSKKGLVLIANGPISIYRVDSFQPLGSGYTSTSTNTLEAFFYTDKKAELYGVGSLFWIHGGFFAKQSLTINAVLGNTSEAAVGGNELKFDDQSQVGERQARFVIDYNQDVFNSQYSGLPRVSQVKVVVGQKQLVTVKD